MQDGRLAFVIRGLARLRRAQVTVNEGLVSSDQIRDWGMPCERGRTHHALALAAAGSRGLYQRPFLVSCDGEEWRGSAPPNRPAKVQCTLECRFLVLGIEGTLTCTTRFGPRAKCWFPKAHRPLVGRVREGQSPSRSYRSVKWAVGISACRRDPGLCRTHRLALTRRAAAPVPWQERKETQRPQRIHGEGGPRGGECRPH